jgi:hypothetical protein
MWVGISLMAGLTCRISLQIAHLYCYCVSMCWTMHQNSGHALQR